MHAATSDAPPRRITGWDAWLSRPILELADRLRDRSVSAEELVQRSLQRIALLNPEVGAFVWVAADSARRAARRIDADRRRGRALPFFAGIPTGIKDLNFLRGMPARLGSAAFRWLWAPFDDVTVTAFRRAGFVFVGKTATSELAIMPVVETDIDPPARNPWDLSRTSGGSSGGASAAVAAGLVPVAHASDGAGSIRIPAALCGLVGHKASARLLPNPYARIDPLAMSTNGAVTRTVDDTAAILDVLLGREPDDPSGFLVRIRRPPAPLRIRCTVRSPIGPVEPGVVQRIHEVCRRLEDLGHTVEENPGLAGLLEEFLPIYQRMSSETPVFRETVLQPVTRWLRESGRPLTREDARRAHASLAARVEGWSGDAEILVTPTVARTAPRIGAYAGSDGESTFRAAAELGAFTAVCNVTGRPAISLPVGLVDGLPVGVQIAGRPGADATVLALARALEATGPF